MQLSKSIEIHADLCSRLPEHLAIYHRRHNTLCVSTTITPGSSRTPSPVQGPESVSQWRWISHTSKITLHLPRFITSTPAILPCKFKSRVPSPAPHALLLYTKLHLPQLFISVHRHGPQLFLQSKCLATQQDDRPIPRSIRSTK